MALFSTSLTSQIQKVSKLTWIYLGILTVVFLVVYGKIYDEKLFIGGDNASYYILGKSLAEGRGYSNIDRPNAGPANHFPPGYPAIVSVIMTVSGQDIDHVKITNGFFMWGSILLLFLLMRRLSGSEHLSFAVSLVLVFNFHLLQYSTWMMSEMSYLFFATLSFFFFIKMLDDKNIFKSPNFYIFLAALIITYYIRTVGLAWLGAALLVLIIQKKWQALVGTLVSFLVCYAPWYLRSKNLGGNSYVKQLTMKNPYRPEEGAMEGFADWWLRFTTNVERYISVLIPKGVLGVNETKMNDQITSSDWFMGFIILALILWGLYKLKEFSFALFAYLGASFLILCLWPEVWYDYRFMVTLIPVLTFLFAHGLYQLVLLGLAKGNIQLGPKIATWLPLAFLVFVPKMSSSIPELEASAKANFPPAYKNYFEIAKWCDKNTEKDAIVVCRKANLFFLFSNRPSAGYKSTKDAEELIDRMEELGVKYVVVEQLGFSSTGLYLVPAIQKHPEKFEVIYQLKNPDTYLLKTKFDMGYNGSYNEGKKHGEGTYRWADGRTYEGSWVNDQKQGKGKMTYPDGSYLQAQWQNDLINGSGVLYDSKGNVLKQGTWQNDILIEEN